MHCCYKSLNAHGFLERVRSHRSFDHACETELLDCVRPSRRREGLEKLNLATVTSNHKVNKVDLEIIYQTCVVDFVTLCGIDIQEFQSLFSCTY